MQKNSTTILVGIIIVLVAALAFALGRQTAPLVQPSPPAPVSPPPTSNPSPMPTTAAVLPTPSPVSTPLVANASDLTPLKGAKPFSEAFDDVTLKFLPTKTFRKLIEYRRGLISSNEDSTCTNVYTVRETVKEIVYAWDFVIKSFTTWSTKEGQQDYIIGEEDLPRAFQGSLHDIVREGRVVTIEKQLCGMGQVEGFVAVRP